MNTKYKRTVFKSFKTLSDGSIAAIYATLEYDPGNKEYYHYVGMAIGKSRRQCNDWFNDKANHRARGLNNRSTGKVGIEGLVWAASELTRLESNIRASLDKDEYGVIYIEAADEKRASAYRRLLKHGYECINGVFRKVVA